MTEALNSIGNEVRVDQAQKGEEYTCPFCQDKVYPRQGQKLAWHFEHATNNECIGVNQPAGVGL